MVNALLALCGLVTVLIIVVAVVSLRTAAAYRDARSAILYNLAPGKDKDGKPLPSPLAQTLDLFAADLAAHMTQSIVSSFNGQASGVNRSLKAVEGDVAQAAMAMSDNPLAQIALALFQKQIKKNPMLGMALANFHPGGGRPAGNHSRNNGQSSFLAVP